MERDAAAGHADNGLTGRRHSTGISDSGPRRGGLDEPLDEAKCRVGDLAPAAIDREGVSASLDLDDLGHGRVALLVFV